MKSRPSVRTVAHLFTPGKCLLSTRVQPLTTQLSIASSLTAGPWTVYRRYGVECRGVRVSGVHCILHLHPARKQGALRAIMYETIESVLMYARASSKPRHEHSLWNPSASPAGSGQCHLTKHHAMLHLSQLPLYGRTPTLFVALRSPLFRSWSRIAERHSCAVSFSSCPCVHILRAVGVMLAIARRNDRYA